MTPTQQQFISLLKCGLWGTHPTAAEFVNADWLAIVKMAKEQCVTALITDAMNELAANNVSIDKAILYKANFDAIRIAHQNVKLNTVLAEVTELLNANNIPSVLLKGQGVAQNYRKPEQRMSGDIDLYVGEANYKKAIDILQHSGNQEVLQNPACAMQKSNETVKHYHMRYGDVQVELHKFANYLYNPIENRYFQRLTKKYLQNPACAKHTSDILQHSGNQAVLQSCGTTSKNTISQSSSNQPVLQNPACVMQKFQTPPPQFDAVFLFSHLFHHYLSGGIGLRQLCDWVRFLYMHKNEIDTTQLGIDLKKTGLLRAWKIFGYIAVDTLGLPTDFFPFYERREEQGEKVLERIYQVGNFGFYNPENGSRPKGYITGKLHSLKNSTRNYLKIFNVFPKATITYFFHHLIIGTAQIFKDKF
jgi:hypothetical protein